MATNTIQSTWDTLPIEIQTMIIESIETPQDIRRAWFTCRQVSRSFKLATELYFRLVVTETDVTTWVGGFSNIRVNGIPLRYYPPCQCVAYHLDFDSYSENGDEVNFGKLETFDATSLFKTNRGTVPMSQVDVLMGRWIPYTVVQKFLWGEFMTHYLNRVPYGKPQGPSLVRSGVMFELPFMDHVSVDYEKTKVTIPFSPMISGLMAQEIAFVEELQLLTSEDLEKTRWRITSSPSVEQGLRIALRSKAVRLVRFEKYMSEAMENVKERSAGGRKIRCVVRDLSDIDGPNGIGDWYDEWVSYIS
ncbi:hypothetical protein F4776DRAFT_394512 [Hypoxylon sp. NC0597]|nr:hypothetical protein F4776DRAFT_394512 [Hypoxylon sp. NC0597]